MIQAELKKTISHSPTGPGIYIFKNFKNKPLYIGKASSLRKRLLSYQKTDDQRTLKMLSLAKHLKTLETDSEIEALILESQYIKKCQPQFNIMLRDDKQYGFVGFTHSTSSGQAEEYPKIFITHQPTKQRSSAVVSSSISKKESFSTALTPTALQPEFIGPFTDISALKTTLRYLRRIFPYCTCRKPHNNFCLNYHIGKCYGICCLKENQNDVSKVKNTYQENIKAIKEILSGKKNLLLKNLEKEEIALGKKMERIVPILSLTESGLQNRESSISNKIKIKDFDEIGKKAIELRDKLEKIRKVFENAHIIRNFPYYDISKNHSKSVLSDLKKVLGLKTTPLRIEGYDIANIQGKYAAGAMVVFENAKPNKNEYRKFKIKYWKHQKYLLQNQHDRGNITTEKNTIIDESVNDTAMLKEILERRFDHPEWPMPDLILVDGGKAQLNAAHSIITKLHNYPITVIALTKDKKHRGIKIYTSGRKSPTPLSQLPTPFKNLFIQVDSEAHRFAISYYRRLHRKTIK